MQSCQGPEGPGHAAVIRWKRCRVQRLSIQRQNTHELRQLFCFSRADGQMRSRAESDLPEAHLKCCMHMFYALALITRGSVRALPDPTRGGNQRSRGMATDTVDTRQTFKIDNMP